jgi:hypothetical protein
MGIIWGISPEKLVGVLTTSVVEMFTTSGSTFFTTGAKPLLLGPSSGFASFREAGGLAVGTSP